MVSQEITAKILRIESQTTPLRSLLSVEQRPYHEKAFAVCAKGLAPLVSHVYYEKDERDLRLYFMLQKGLDLTIIVGDMPPAHNNASDPLGLLFKRTFATLSREKERGVFRLIVSSRDFQETGTSPKDLARLFSLLKSRLGDDFSYLAFFETREGFRAILQSPHEHLHASFARVARTEQKEGWSLSSTCWDSLDRACAAFSSLA